jgi:hypothetical protein
VLTTTSQVVTHIRESRWFESMYTLQGKPDTHDTYTSRASPHMPLVRFLRGVPVRGNLLRSCQQHWTKLLLPRKRAPVPIHSTPADWSSRGKAKHLLSTSYIGLLGTYHQYVISTFNTCSWGPTHRSLTDIGRGYNLTGVGFLHHTPQPSQLMVLHFPLVALPSLRLTNLNISL